MNGEMRAPAESEIAARAARVAGFSSDPRQTVDPGLRFYGPLYSGVSDSRLLLPPPEPMQRADRTLKPVAYRPSDAMADAELDGCSIVAPEDTDRDLDTDARWWPLRRVAWWLSRDARGTPGLERALHSLAEGEQDSPEAVHAGDSDDAPGPDAQRLKVSGHERRWGHARTADGVPEEAALFSRSVRRFVQDAAGPALASAACVGLVRGDEGCLPRAGSPLVRLGGDAHLARLSIAAGDAPLEPARALLDVVTACLEQGVTGIQMYVATPAIFKTGWRPRVLGDALRLRAAAVGRPQIVAGWDLRRRAPKPVRRAVPAGSVYFFEVANAAGALDAIRRYHLNESVSDDDGRLGFGCALFGVWRTGEAR